MYYESSMNIPIDCVRKPQTNQKKVSFISSDCTSVFSGTFLPSCLQEYEQKMSSAGLPVEQSVWRPASSHQLDSLKQRESAHVTVRQQRAALLLTKR